LRRWPVLLQHQRYATIAGTDDESLGAAAVERAVRAVRDRFLIEPLARSRLIQRYAHFFYDYSVKKMGDHIIAYDPKDRGAIGSHLTRYGEWCRDDFRSILSALARAGRETKGKVFVDVGANIGTQTIYALIEHDFARAISIEPAPENISLLGINITLNGLRDRVIVERCAAGPQRERKSLIVNKADIAIHSFVEKLALLDDRICRVDVDVLPVDAILQKHDVRPADVGLVLIDVEGFEPDVIAGAQQVIEARVPLFLEFNSHVYGRLGTADLLHLLGKHYTTAYSHGTKGLPARAFDVSEIDDHYLPSDLLFF
jgi:FkbM family methyltransferase